MYKFTLIISALILCGFKSCVSDCLPIPSQDVTPPTAGIFVEYYVDGQSKTQSFSESDQELHLEADKNRKITILYSGQDSEGMKSLQISITVHRQSGGLGQREDWDTMPITLNCPKKLIMDNLEFGPGGGERGIVLSVRSKNWVGLLTMTKSLIINVK